jgi:protein O-GlcNAc transferase
MMLDALMKRFLAYPYPGRGEPAVRYFVLGFPKSGTSTLEKAFERAGLRAAHWRVRQGYCGELIYRDFLAARGPLHTLRKYDVIAQADVCLPATSPTERSINYWPQLDFNVIQAIQEHHPTTKFILNTRDIAELISSIDRWSELRQRMTIMDIPGLPIGAGSQDEELHDWIAGHYAACRSHFAACPDYLEYDIDDQSAPRKLEDFTGVKMPWWGIANQNKHRPLVKP